MTRAYMVVVDGVAVVPATPVIRSPVGDRGDLHQRSVVEFFGIFRVRF